MRITKQAETLGRMMTKKTMNKIMNKIIKHQHSPSRTTRSQLIPRRPQNAELLELETGKGFCECVSDHVVSGTIEESDVLLRNGLSNKVKVDVNMFSATMKGGILRETYHALVIAIKGCR